MTKPNCDIYADGGPCNKLKQKPEFSSIVNCDSDGFFEEIQCTESNCYCVDKNTGMDWTNKTGKARKLKFIKI